MFSECVVFSACAIGLPGLLGPRLLCPLGHQRDRETCPEVAGQDSKLRSCPILPGRAGEPGHEGLSEVLVILQPNTGGEREVGGEGCAGEG